MKVVYGILILALFSNIANSQEAQESKVEKVFVPSHEYQTRNAIIYSEEYRQLLSIVYENKAKIDSGLLSKEVLSELKVKDNDAANRLGTLETFYTDQLGKQDKRIEDLGRHVDWYFAGFGLILVVLGFLTFKVTSKNIEQEAKRVTKQWGDAELPEIRKELKTSAERQIQEQISDRAKVAEEQVNAEIENAQRVIADLNTLVDEAELKFEDIKRIHLKVRQQEQNKELEIAKQRSSTEKVKNADDLPLSTSWAEVLKRIKTKPSDQEDG